MRLGLPAKRRLTTPNAPSKAYIRPLSARVLGDRWGTCPAAVSNPKAVVRRRLVRRLEAGPPRGPLGQPRPRRGVRLPKLPYQPLHGPAGGPGGRAASLISVV